MRLHLLHQTIVKKRIDKALVRGTGERLTQPGTIAIVFSQEREAREYGRHIEYLQSSGYLEGEIETMELEDLQGVFGLKAIRVKIAPAKQAGVDRGFWTTDRPFPETSRKVFVDCGRWTGGGGKAVERAERPATFRSTRPPCRRTGLLIPRAARL